MLGVPRSIALGVAAALAVACGDDGPTAVPVDFPALNAAVQDSLCWAGNRTPRSGASGRIEPTDCDTADLENVTISGYYESWRFRVDQSRSVTISTDAAIDPYLILVRLDSISAGNGPRYTVLAVHDDIGLDNFNARIVRTLDPGIDYFVLVAGFDYAQQGSYAVSFN